jgi:DNA-binding response OmpR family regulator
MPAPKTKNLTRSGTILIAEDDADDRFFLQQAFSTLGFKGNMSFAYNGRQVLSYLDEIKDPKEYPSLIIMDLNMPLLSGNLTLAELKKNRRYQSIQVVVFSSSMNENEKIECLEMGAYAYFVKPDNSAQLLKIVQEFIDISIDPPPIDNLDISRHSLRFRLSDDHNREN